MKKSLIVLCFIVGSFSRAFADPIFAYTSPSTPATGTAASNPSQILASLLEHVTAVSEFTSHGQNKLEFLDGIIQAGHFNKDYILAIDGGVCNSLSPDTQGHVAGTFGVHVHVVSLLNSVFNVNPALAETLNLLELTPRESWDGDVRHGVFGVTFGARIPFQ